MRYPSCSPILPALLVILATPACQRARAAAVSPALFAQARPDGQVADAQPARRMPQVDAVLTEWDVDLSRDTVDAGRIAFDVINGGTMIHAFEVAGANREWQTQRLLPGESTTLLTDLTPGVYKVYCPVEGEHGEHDALGMRTALVVR